MRRRILVVDDDRSIRRTFEGHLAEEGWEVRALGDPREALRAVATFEPSIVLTDVRMEDLDGIELTRRLLQGRADLAVVVMTAYEDMRTAVDAMVAGAADYLVKPLDLDRVDEVLERTLLALSLGAESDGRADTGIRAPTGDLVGTHPSMIEIFKTIGVVAPTRSTVLIRGETGTGKERIARAIHAASPWAEEPFVAVNCTAVTPTLLESELFGHAEGAFTGAVGSKRGFFEVAGEGTLFLDEIGDTSPEFQGKLLRVLEEGQVLPVGAEKPRQVRARVMAATHRPLESMIDDEAFREDLYFRLRVVEIRVPPLRERMEDVETLTYHLIDRIRSRMAMPVAGITDRALERLTRYDWPGNVRELENELARAAVRARGAVIDEGHLDPGRAGVAGTRAAHVDPDATLAEMEAAHVQAALDRLEGNKRQTARALGISRPRLDRIIDRYALRVPGRRVGGNES